MGLKCGVIGNTLGTQKILLPTPTKFKTKKSNPFLGLGTYTCQPHFAPKT